MLNHALNRLKSAINEDTEDLIGSVIFIQTGVVGVATKKGAKRIHTSESFQLNDRVIVSGATINKIQEVDNATTFFV